MGREGKRAPPIEIFGYTTGGQRVKGKRLAGHKLNYSVSFNLVYFGLHVFSCMCVGFVAFY